MADPQPQEEQFLLYLPEELATRLQDAIQNTPADGQLPDIQLDMHTGRCGKFKLAFPGETATEHIASLHEVPTIIELFKSHNNTNLMKAGDIGQVLIVQEASNPGEVDSGLQYLIEASVSGDPAQYPPEMKRGLTPPMHKGRAVFKYQPHAEPQLVEMVERQLVDLMHGEAPKGWVIEDVAEIWVPDKEAVNGGAWWPLADVSTTTLKELAKSV